MVATDLTALERELPPSIRSLVQRKVDALTDEERRLLGAASVQGVDFDSAVLADATARPQEDVEDRLDRLERAHALVRFVSEREYPDRSLALRYRFAHIVYQRAFHDALRVTRHAGLARAVAASILARMGARSDERALDLALLFETARDHLQAAMHFATAARSAARLYAHDESERLARRGLAAVAQAPAGAERSAVELDLQMSYGLALRPRAAMPCPRSAGPMPARASCAGRSTTRAA